MKDISNAFYNQKFIRHLYHLYQCSVCVTLPYGKIFLADDFLTD
jgi:hypothetical protein